ARQKLEELRLLADALDARPGAEARLAAARERHEARRRSTRVHLPDVAARTAALRPATSQRPSPHPVRRGRQDARLRLPPYPTTTIGSFPQTREVRQARALNRAGKLADAEYEAFLAAEIERCVRLQEAIGI